jgi:hypothetical protein
MEVFDRSLTHIPIEMHTKYLSNFHIRYISNSDQFVSSGMGPCSIGNDLEPNMRPWPNLESRFGTPIWDPDLGPRFGTPIWDPDLGP